MTLLKKENLTISIGEYQNNNGDTKQEWKTIGELITMQGSDGPYQFFKLWGAGGAVEGKVFEQQERTNNNQQSQQQPQQQQAQQQQGGYQQPNNQQQNYNNGR
jgi:hypothetical protein